MKTATLPRIWTWAKRLAIFFALFMVVGVTSILCGIQWPWGRVPMWVTDPIILVCLLRTRPKVWPAILGVSFVSLLLVTSMAKLALANVLYISISSIVEVAVVAAVLRRFLGPRLDILQVRHVVVFTVVTAIACIINLTIMRTLLHELTESGDAVAFVYYALGNILSYWAVTPCLLILGEAKHWARRRLSASDALILGAFGVAGVVAFGQHTYPLVFLAAAPLLIITLRHELVGSALGVIATAGLAIGFTAAGHGPFAQIALADQKAVIMQVFMVLTLASTVPLAAQLERKRLLEVSLVEARDAAQAAAVVKAEFLATMSHELRTPLTSVIGFAGLLADKKDVGEENRGYVTRISIAAKSLLSTINDLLDFSKLEAGEVEFAYQPCDAGVIAGEALDMFALQAEARGVGLALTGAYTAPAQLMLDPDRIRQVLLNFISNAAKFTEKGSIELRLNYDGAAERLEVSVIDTGPGIAPDQIGRLFQRFSQVKDGAHKKHGGTGLGLAICKSLVEGMGGQVGVESEPGKGSRFFFWVPAKVAAIDEAAAQTEATLDLSILQGRRLLVADDNPANQELVAAMLRPFGMTTAVASSGEEALALCQAERHDAVLMDLRMAGMGGYEAARRIRALGGHASDLPIIAFSGDVADGVGPNADFDAAVRKPVTVAALIGALVQQLAARPAYGEAQPEALRA